MDVDIHQEWNRDPATHQVPVDCREQQQWQPSEQDKEKNALAHQFEGGAGQPRAVEKLE